MKTGKSHNNYNGGIKHDIFQNNRGIQTNNLCYDFATTGLALILLKNYWATTMPKPPWVAPTSGEVRERPGDAQQPGPPETPPHLWPGDAQQPWPPETPPLNS